MVYKFKNGSTSAILEVFNANELVRFCISNNVEDSKILDFTFIDLDKNDLFELIGALHCIQKKIK